MRRRKNSSRHRTKTFSSPKNHKLPNKVINYAFLFTLLGLKRLWQVSQDVFDFNSDRVFFTSYATFLNISSASDIYVRDILTEFSPNLVNGDYLCDKQTDGTVIFHCSFGTDFYVEDILIHCMIIFHQSFVQNAYLCDIFTDGMFFTSREKHAVGKNVTDVNKPSRCLLLPRCTRPI